MDLGLTTKSVTPHRRVANLIAPSACRVAGMANPDGCIPGRRGGQPHKGPRVLVQSRLPEDVHAEVARRAKALGLPVSQYVADWICRHIGRDDLVRDLDKAEGLPLAM